MTRASVTCRTGDGPARQGKDGPSLRLIIIGATGAIGSALEAAARRAGDDVVGCSRSVGGGVSFDVRTDDLAAAIPDIDADDRVVLLAAVSDQNWVCEHPDDAREVNVGAAARIARQADTIGCHLTVMSSEAVFGMDHDDGYRENDIPNPVTEYGRQKMEMEKTVQAHAPEAAIIRTGWNVPWTQGSRCPVRQTYDALLRDDAVMATDYFQTVTDIDDTASGILAAARMKHSGPLHLAAQPPIARSRLADLVIENSRHGRSMRYRAGRIADIPFKEPRAARACLSGDLIRPKLGMTFRPPEETVRLKVALLERDRRKGTHPNDTDPAC